MASSRKQLGAGWEATWAHQTIRITSPGKDKAAALRLHRGIAKKLQSTTTTRATCLPASLWGVWPSLLAKPQDLEPQTKVSLGTINQFF